MAHNINISNYGGGADDSGGAGDVVGSGGGDGGGGEPFFASYPVLPDRSTISKFSTDCFLFSRYFFSTEIVVGFVLYMIHVAKNLRRISARFARLRLL